MRKQGLRIMLSGLVIALYFTGIYAYAGSKVSADGMLTAVEDDGSVIIDEQGYLADSTVRVLDSNSKKISLEKLSLPAKVYFEYEYTSKGPVIKLIKEIPKVRPE